MAATNPYAWDPRPRTADEIGNPGPGNRMVNYPYTKYMNANLDVDLGAAVILAAGEEAARIGVPRDRWVFLHGAAQGSDTTYLSNRIRLDRSPAIAAVGRAALGAAGVGPGDLAHVDLYSCFPCAVQIAADELGLDEDGPLTLTGGLTFAGGPMNNYVTHSLATAVDVLRADPGSYGLVTANGGYLSKHAMGVYSTKPPTTAMAVVDADAGTEGRPLDEGYEGHARIEAYTVMHDGDGPTHALMALLTPDGSRAWGRSHDRDLLHEGLTRDIVSVPCHRERGGTVALK